MSGKRAKERRRQPGRETENVPRGVTSQQTIPFDIGKGRADYATLYDAMANRNMLLRYDHGAVIRAILNQLPPGDHPQPTGDQYDNLLRVTAESIVYPLHRRLILGEYIPNATIELRDKKHEAVFSYEQPRESGVPQSIEITYENLPGWLIDWLRFDLGHYTRPTVEMPNKMVETINPLITKKTLKDLKGQKITDAVMDEVTQQNLAHHAPILVDLLRFYKENRDDSARVQILLEEDGRTAAEIRLFPNSIRELTGGLTGKAADDAAQELEDLMRKPMRFILRTDKDGAMVSDKFKSPTGRKRRGPTMKTGLIRTFTRDTRPIMIAVHPYLLVLEHGDLFRRLPANLREWWAQSRKRNRSQQMENAYFWAHQQLNLAPRQRRNSLMDAFGIDRYSKEARKNPRRIEEGFQDCLDFLIDTEAVKLCKVKKDSDNPMVGFILNQHHLTHLVRKPAIMGAVEAPEWAR